MIQTEIVKPISNAVMEEVGMAWHTDSDGTPYIMNEIIAVTQEEAEAYYTAANELYDMYVQAAQHVMQFPRR